MQESDQSIAISATIKALLIPAILLTIQVPLIFFQFLGLDGCGKFYIPRHIYDGQVWLGAAISFVFHIVVLSYFMSDSLRRPDLLLSKLALLVWACFLVWKALASMLLIQQASGCLAHYGVIKARVFVDMNEAFLRGFSGLAWFLMFSLSSIATARACLLPMNNADAIDNP